MKIYEVIYTTVETSQNVQQTGVNSNDRRMVLHFNHKMAKLLVNNDRITTKVSLCFYTNLNDWVIKVWRKEN